MWFLRAQRSKQVTYCMREKLVAVKDDMVPWHAMYMVGGDDVGKYLVMSESGNRLK